MLFPNKARNVRAKNIVFFRRREILHRRDRYLPNVPRLPLSFDKIYFLILLLRKTKGTLNRVPFYYDQKDQRYSAQQLSAPSAHCVPLALQ